MHFEVWDSFFGAMPVHQMSNYQMTIYPEVKGNTCGLYYKHITIVNDDPSVVNKWCHNLEHQLLMMLDSSFMIVIWL
jgi:hypothetical protein